MWTTLRFAAGCPHYLDKLYWVFLKRAYPHSPQPRRRRILLLIIRVESVALLTGMVAHFFRTSGSRYSGTVAPPHRYNHPVFSVNTTPTAKCRPERLWMCFHEQTHKQKYRAFLCHHRQKAHFRQMANHRETLYLSRFSGIYLFFTFDINTTHSTCLDGME